MPGCDFNTVHVLLWRNHWHKVFTEHCYKSTALLCVSLNFMTMLKCIFAFWISLLVVQHHLHHIETIITTIFITVEIPSMQSGIHY